MKNIFIDVFFVLILFNFVNSECNHRHEKIIKQCYNIFFKSLNITVISDSEAIAYPESTKNKKFCKIFGEKEKCLGDDEKHCLNVEKFSKVFGVSDAEAIKFLLFDYSSQYSCENSFDKDYKIKEKTIDCEMTINFTDECPLTGKGCKMTKNLFECYKHVLEYNCKDKKWLEFRSKTWKYAMEKTWSLCRF